jgi:hypothetical protein
VNIAGVFDSIIAIPFRCICVMDEAFRELASG